MPPKAIFLDLDDTIISFDGASQRAWVEICRAFAQENPQISEKELLTSIFQTREWFWGDTERHRIGRRDLVKARRIIVKTALAHLGHTDEERIVEMADSYTRLQEQSVAPFPGAIDALEDIKASGIPMALITNGTIASQRAKIERFDLEKYFTFCLIEEEVGFGKPDVRVFELALHKIGYPAGDVWMVGDNLVWDIQAPQSLGIYAVWNDWRQEGLPRDSDIRPDRVIHSIAELPPLIDPAKE